MPSAHLALKEEEVIRLVLEFLSNRELSISQLAVEREAGVINGIYSDDVLYLRQLILDGQWDDVLQFIQPLEGFENFDSKQFKFIVIKHKYIELLCIRSESGPFSNLDVAVAEVVKSLNELEKYCPSKEDYNNLCLLLTLPRLSDNFDYRNWNPSNARVNCFKAVLPLVEKYLPVDKKAEESQKTAKGDRLIQLIIKGILYESCVEYCQQRATSSSLETQEMGFSHILSGTGFSDSDLSLLSWLQCIPPETFSYPFEQKTLSVDVEQLDKPSLEASWTEHILVTPIKPKIFPYSVMPSRPRTSDYMSKSLTPNLDALGHSRNLMAYSMIDISNMSRSFAGFHLTGKKAMNTSVDRLFEGGDVFSTSCADLETVLESPISSTKSKIPPKILEQTDCDESLGTAQHASAVNTILKDTNFDSLQPSSVLETPRREIEGLKDQSYALSEGKSMSDLWKEFQRHKQQVIKEIQAAEKADVISGQSKMVTPNLTADSSLLAIGVQDESAATSTPYPSSSHSRSHQLSSTPKPSGSREVTPVPQTSPVLSRNGAGSGDSSSIRPELVTRNLYPAVNSMVSPPYSCGSPGSVSASHKMQPQSSPSSLSPASGGQVITHQGMESPQYRGSPIHTSKMSDGTKHVPLMCTKGTYDIYDSKKPRFITVTRLEDAQAIRAAEFHPSGHLYAIGSNSKTLRICAYPKINDLRDDYTTHQPTVLYKKVKHHKGSIYCLSWNPSGDLLATGSNDKTVKLMKFNMETCNVEPNEAELTMHDGTVRDMCFIEDSSNRSSLLISGGAGDCKIYVTDCETATPFQALSGHSGHILALYTWGGAMFVSGSQDRTIRFWDLRTKGCVHFITPPPASGTGQGSPVSAICVDPSGRLLVSGQEDANCMLYDIRGSRIIQCFRPHVADIRTIRFSPKAYYLLTGSYDHKVVLTDLQGDLTQPLPMIVVAEHADKVIQGRWHPRDFSFLTTSADKTATLWALPPN